METRPRAFASYVADLYRADVHRADIGSDGYCGFTIPMGHFEWEGPYRIHDSVFQRPLDASPFVAGDPERAPCPHAAGHDLEFHLDPIGSRLSGWLSSIDPSATRRRIVLKADGRIIARQSACLYRDVAVSAALDPFHGFSLALPRQRCMIALVDAETDTTLYEARL